MRDLHNNIKVSRAISPVTQTNLDTAFVAQIIDNQGYESLEYAIAYGAITDADVTFTTLLEESDDSGMAGAAAVADKDLLGTEVGATPLFSDDDKVFKLGYTGSKRYTRLTVTPAANNAGAISIAAVAIQSHARHAPAGATQTP